ncbi:MAG TPA: TIGR03364 family FAD-dependent oxidoreductase [Bryobacteraceae bacterium]|nr:TIGR03364 family FAD-dependent oxidoreductase [Bryobacteraceae bacterium]
MVTAARSADAAVVGAGIIGLAHAYALARRGRSVVVFERSPRAAGASVRNFGMIWPVGQPAGRMHQMALRSRELWLEVLAGARLPYYPTGSLHVVRRTDEADVAREFCDTAPSLGYVCEWLDPAAVLARSSTVRADGLLGAIWSPTEITVDPRVTLARLPDYLSARFGVQFRFETAVREIDLPAVHAGGETWRAETAIVCTGHDFEMLYPEIFRASGLTRAKLQMMRTHPQPEGWQLGPALAAGLTLRFYESFRICRTLAALERRIAAETPAYDRWGIHVLASQTAAGELTIGDSHEYGAAVDPFDRAEIDELILDYARGFLQAPEWRIAQHWHGVYAKLADGPYLSASPAPGVRVVTGTGGAGMTLSFGIAEQTMTEMGF